MKIFLFGLSIFVAGGAGLYSADGSHQGDLRADHPSAPNEPLPKFNSRDYLFGDWFGLRQTLYESGIELNASYTTEPAWNPVGGLREDATYLDNFGLSALFDLEQLLGIPNTTFFASGSQRSGDSLAEEAIGSAISAQQIFGGGQTHRLVELRMRHMLFQEQLDLSYGRLSATSDFMASPFYCQFVTNGICGQPTAPFFNMPGGLTAYPESTWGMVARLQTKNKELYSMFGIYDGDPFPDEHGADFDFGDNGVLLIGEIGFRPEEGLLGLPARYSLGAFHHTGDFPDVATDSIGGNLLASGSTGIPREMSGQEGFYVVVEQLLYREGAQSNRGLQGFFTFVVSPDEEKSPMPYFFNTGFIYEGLFQGRPNDKAAIGMYSAWFSSDLRDAQRRAGQRTQSSETTLEVNYQVQLTPYTYIRPNVQYIADPNGLSEIDDALVVGVEFGVTF